VLSVSLFEALLNDSATEAVALLDAILWEADTGRRHFDFVGGRAEDMLGYPLSAWYEDGFWRRIVEPEDLALAEFYFQEAVGRGGDHGHEYRVRRADGTVRWIRDRVYVAEDGGAAPLRGVTIDVTARRELEDRFAQAQKMDAVGQLAGSVARDFNRLLIAIGGSVDLLLAGTQDETSLARLREIGEEASRGGELVAQLFAFGRRAFAAGESSGELDVLTRGVEFNDSDGQLLLAENPQRERAAVVVDQESAVRQVARSVLEGEGYLVHEAANGLQALECLEEAAGKIDLILSDVVMSDLTGPEMIARLRPLQHGTRVLFMCGYADGGLLRQGGLDERRVGVLQRPFTPEELAARVAQLMAADDHGAAG
jgi:PAS domain S-box-containing protein